MDVNELSDRLKRVERENRRMKRAGIAVVVIALAGTLIGAAKPDKIPEFLDARVFRVIDENGNVRAGMSAKAISYYDENGQGRAYLSANAIGYTDANGKERAAMDARGIWFYDQNGRTRAVLNDKGVGYSDENGAPRAYLGAIDIVDQETGATSRAPASVALFDADGTKVWQAPE